MAFPARRNSESELYSRKYHAAIATECHDRGIVLASHDDTTVSLVNEAIEQVVHVAEFPTTIGASQRCGRA